MQLKLTTIINSIVMIASAASIVGAVALPEAELLEKRQCLPLNAICTGPLQCCSFPTVGCYGPPGLNSIKRCKVSGSG
ncbi:hypothetical protein CVT24_003278 [Panaeolus cyanescens]|uniref:Uncharacterized protein n=1 Tax=Panaeolus cyanescens TaxID=181874 RepID=A0A409YR94_9AGAR|nr:hypothetical protein CVT24_003278 [Panaeolus cyanescens]